MKWINYLLLTFGISLTLGCNKDDDNTNNNYTGREITYQLLSDSEYNTSGTVTFKEKRDGSLEAIIAISPTGENIFHPVHLHYGIYQKDAPMAAMLEPVNGKTGKSITETITLEDYSLLSYDELLSFNGHVKIHGDDDANKDLILAYANIGSNTALNELAFTISMCK